MPATIYIICLIVGGGLLLISTVFAGHGDADVDVDAPADASLGADASGHDLAEGGAADHGFSLASWFSVQFAVYFLAVFGLIGTTLSYWSGLGTPTVLLIALSAGLLLGQGAHQTIRLLKRTGGGSEVSAEDFLNRSGRVTVAIHPPRHGEIAVSLHSGERFVSAAAKRPDDRFGVGDCVVISSFRNGVAEVVSRQEFEFVAGSNLDG